MPDPAKAPKDRDTASAARRETGRARLGAWVPAILWAVVILALTSFPNPDTVVPSVPAGTDKLVHAALYGVFGLLVWRALAATVVVTPRVLAAAAAAIASFGALDEIKQRYVPGRGAEVADWLADTAGATAALLIAQTQSARVRRESAP